jgi:FMN phosphatase YigB (HAD superfamily)
VLNGDSVVFMLDVDNTLLDNDRFAADLTARLDRDFGQLERERYWSIYTDLRDRVGYADYLGALQAFRAGAGDEPALLRMSAFLLDYPFSERVYPRALAALEHLRTIGTTAIVSDGDIVFQPRKIQRSGLWDVVNGRVLVTVHKERRLDLVQRRFPANHYVMIDDKPQLLAAMKRVLAGRLTTAFVRQGHYARESDGLALDSMPDLAVAHIGDLCDVALPDFYAATAGRAADTDRHRKSEAHHQEQA